MKRFAAYLAAMALTLSLAIQAQAVITQQQAVQAVRNFIGNQNAEVTYAEGVTGITYREYIPSMQSFWMDTSPYYEMVCGNYQYNVDGNTGFIKSTTVLSDLNVYPSDALNAETMWARYSMLPRSQMQHREQDWWVLGFTDGSWDMNVQLGFERDNNGLIEQANAWYEPVAANRPAITLSAQQATNIARSVAGSYCWQDEEEYVYSYPYFDLDHVDGVDWRTNAQNMPEPVYHVAFVVSSDHDVSSSWPNSEPSHDLSNCALFDVYVNAATGAILYTCSDEFLGGEGPKGVKAHTGLTSKDKSAMLVPLSTLQSLGKGHKIAALKGSKVLTVDGKKSSLPGCAVMVKGKLYLPWQSLKAIPGVRPAYNAKNNALSIATTGTVVTAKGAAKCTSMVKKKK